MARSGKARVVQNSGGYYRPPEFSEGRSTMHKNNQPGRSSSACGHLRRLGSAAALLRNDGRRRSSALRGIPGPSPLGQSQEGSIMPITANSYDARSGEMTYMISAEEAGEGFKLAVTPKDRNCNQLTFWQGDRYDENNFLVAQSDPLR